MNTESLFLKATEIEDSIRRTEFIESATAEPSVKREVLRLLEAYERPDEFLESPVGGDATVDSSPFAVAPGTMVGNYKLLQQIGEGGFGVVYMAERTGEIHQKVAIKIVKPGMETKEVIARFEAERQALAMMDHPNVARVIDAGTTEPGRPYFVMELVKGVAITEYCDANNMPNQDRLRLFMQVCAAIQHAHQKGIIHRDIKPSNVLVTLVDGSPVPKVIDFGVAKALNQRLTEKTLFTSYGHMIGTPQYMSPEQAELSALDVDTRSDVFSLGVMLYELLTGTTPVRKEQFRSAAFDELRRLIREEEAERPSHRVSTLGVRASVIATKRGVAAKSLHQYVKGDLDWIVLKTLEKAPSRRYDTPKNLAEDIERFLDTKPVMARRPSLPYRFQKLVRRNSRNLITATLILMVSTAAVLLFLRPDVPNDAPATTTLLAAFEKHFDDKDYKSAERVLQEAQRRFIETMPGSLSNTEQLMTATIDLTQAQGTPEKAVDFAEELVVHARDANVASDDLEDLEEQLGLCRWFAAFHLCVHGTSNVEFEKATKYMEFTSQDTEADNYNTLIRAFTQTRTGQPSQALDLLTSQTQPVYNGLFEMVAAETVSQLGYANESKILVAAITPGIKRIRAPGFEKKGLRSYHALIHPLYDELLAEFDIDDPAVVQIPHEKTIDALDNLSKLFPYYALIPYLRARQHLAYGDLDRAYVDSALAAQLGHTTARYLAGAIAFVRGDGESYKKYASMTPPSMVNVVRWERPDAITFLCLSPDCESAEQLQELMESSQELPRTYAALRCADFERVQSAMERPGFDNSAALQALVAIAYARLGDLDEAQSKLKDARNVLAKLEVEQRERSVNGFYIERQPGVIRIASMAAIAEAERTIQAMQTSSAESKSK